MPDPDLFFYTQENKKLRLKIAAVRTLINNAKAAKDLGEIVNQLNTISDILSHVPQKKGFANVSSASHHVCD